MITNVSSSGYQSNMFQSVQKSMTEDQKTTMKEIVSKYDPDSMDEETLKQMMDEIKEAGITPSKEFGEIMNAAGFKKPEKPEGAGSGMPPPMKNSGQKLPDFITDFVKKQEEGSTSQEDVDSFLLKLKEYGISEEGLFVDKKA